MADAFDPLLSAIIEHPDDDAPRLIYADWQDEHGDADRATFIRAQLQLARMPLDNRTRAALIQSERTLWNKNRLRWLAPLPKWVRIHAFHRGFAESIRCDARYFLEGSRELRQQIPLRDVRLDGSQKTAMPTFHSRVLEGIRSLRISMHVPAGVWSVFTESPYLGQLETLNLSTCTYPQTVVAALPTSSAFPSLRSLKLQQCTLGDEQLIRLVDHRWVARLRHLDLSHNHIFLDGARAIAESPHLSNIESLILTGNPFDDHLASVNALRNRFGLRLRI